MKKVNHFLIYFIVCFSILIHIPACSSMSLSKSATPTVFPEWLTSWLRNPACQPPCWENITPGKTKIDEVIAMIEIIPGINILATPSDFSFGKGVAEWKIPNSNDYVLVRADSKTEIVQIISIDTEENVQLEEIIRIFGNPDHVWVNRCRGFIFHGEYVCQVDLLYDSLGMDLQTNKGTSFVNNYQINISPKLSIENIIFFQPEDEGLKYVLGYDYYLALTQFINWKGYQKYKSSKSR